MENRKNANSYSELAWARGVARFRRRAVDAVDATRLAEIVVGQDAAVAPLDRLTNGTAGDIELVES